MQAGGKDAETIAVAKPLLEKVDRRGDWLRAWPPCGSVPAPHSFATAQDQGAKDAALEELTEATKMVIDAWPDKAEADDARIALGQASLVQGRPRGAGSFRAGQSALQGSWRCWWPHKPICG